MSVSMRLSSTFLLLVFIMVFIQLYFSDCFPVKAGLSTSMRLQNFVLLDNKKQKEPTADEESVQVNPIYKVRARVDTMLDPPQSRTNDFQETVKFDSLDDMLVKARRRKGNVLLIKCQAMLDKPLFRIPQPIEASIQISDLLVICIAIYIQAYSFAAGLLIGKLTAAPLRNAIKPPLQVQIFLTPFWPILLAIVFDQWI